MNYLGTINTLQDLKKILGAGLPALSEEIRRLFRIELEHGGCLR